MIQLNLLPDVKKEYIKAKRTKRFIASVCLVVTAGALGATFLLFSVVKFAQTKNINDLTTDIETKIEEINNIEDIDKILTIQNQINALDGLHTQKPEFSRMFVYLNQLTPEKATIGELDVDVVNSTVSLTGAADAFSTINEFADTLKFARYRVVPVDENGDPIELTEADLIPTDEDPRAFSSVLTQLSRDDESATYTIEMSFDPAIFDNTLDIRMIVPKTITTRSVLNRPDIGNNGLFEEVNIPEEDQ